MIYLNIEIKKFVIEFINILKYNYKYICIIISIYICHHNKTFQRGEPCIHYLTFIL
jgi:hypothetical protein